MTMKVKAAPAAFFQENVMAASNSAQSCNDPDRLSWEDVEECGLQPVAAGSQDASEE
ncbi:hypothetical protein ACW0US_17735 [Xanthomonas euvesicatoria]